MIQNFHQRRSMDNYRVYGLARKTQHATHEVAGPWFRDARRKIHGLGLLDARRKILQESASGILRRSATVPIVLQSWRDSIVFMFTSHRLFCFGFEIDMFLYVIKPSVFL